MRAFTKEDKLDIEWLSTQEAAEYLKISCGQLRNYVSEGLVPYYKLGRSNRYIKSDLDDVILRNKGQYYDDSTRG